MSTPVRTPFNIKLSAEEKARLEEHRVAMGLRSHAEVVRFWIATETKADWLDRVSIEPSRLSEHVMPALDAMRIIEELPIEQRLPADKVATMKKAASPKAAAGPFKSRLKGEWKVP